MGSSDCYYIRAPIGGSLTLHKKSLRWQAFLKYFGRTIAPWPITFFLGMVIDYYI